MRYALLLSLICASVCAVESPTVGPASPPLAHQDVVIESDVARATFSTDCGHLKLFELKSISRLELPKHLEETVKNKVQPGPLPVLRKFQASGAHNFFANKNPATGGLGLGDDAPWNVIRTSPQSVEFVLEKAGRFRWSLAYRLDAKRPCLYTELTITNLGDKAASIQPSMVPLNGLHQDYGPGEIAYSSAFVHAGGIEGKIGAETIPFAGAEVTPLSRDVPIDYLGLKSRFFAAWWTPNAVSTVELPTIAAVPSAAGPTVGATPTATSGPVITAQPSDWSAYVRGFSGFDAEHQGYIVITYAQSDLAPGASWSRSWSLSASSMKKGDLAAFSDLEQRIRYSDGLYRFFKVLANALTWILDMLAHVVVNYGMAVVLLTVLIKAALYRTTFKQQESMLKMQRIQPELKYVQEQYKNNKQMLAQKQMELFKKHGVNPLGGCLPILIQIPIFFALFQAFSHNADLRGAGFLWIHDLTLPDQVCGMPIAFLDNWILSLNPLPIIYVLVSIWMGFAQKPPTNGDPSQEMMFKMMRWMPAAFGLIFYNMPSGLVLYFTVQAVISTLEMKYIRAKLGM